MACKWLVPFAGRTKRRRKEEEEEQGGEGGRGGGRCRMRRRVRRSPDPSLPVAYQPLTKLDLTSYFHRTHKTLLNTT